MNKTIELVSINDISNVVENKECNDRYYYYIKNKDVGYEDIIYKLVVVMDLGCTPREVFYTKDSKIDNFETCKIVGKTKSYNNKSVNIYNKCIKSNPNMERILINNINDAWFKF